MTTWDAYVATVDELDAVRREAVAAVAAQEQAAKAAQIELAAVRQRIAVQRARLGEVAARAGRPAPLVDPAEPDRGGGAEVVPAAVVDPTPGISAALKGVWTTLDAADAALSIASEAPAGGGLLPAWPPAARYALPYAWYAALAVVVVAVINAYAYGSPQARAVALLFDVVVPAGAFVLGLLSVRLVFGAGHADRRSRGALIGATICAAPFAVGVILSIL